MTTERSCTSQTGVLVISWSDVSWRQLTPLVDSGDMPNLSRIIESGAIGNIATIRSNNHRRRRLAALTGMAPSPLRETRPSSTHLPSYVTSQGKKVTIAGGGQNPQRSRPVAQSEASSDEFESYVNKISTDPEISTILRRELRSAFDRTIQISEAAIEQRNAGADLHFVFFDPTASYVHWLDTFPASRLTGKAEPKCNLRTEILKQTYMLYDRLLGSLVAHPGQECVPIMLYSENPPTIVADDGGGHFGPHGVWHTNTDNTPYGILALRHSNVAPDSRLYGATLLDIFPTALALLALPAPALLKGRSLIEAHDRAEPQPPPKTDLTAKDSQGSRNDAAGESRSQNALQSEFEAEVADLARRWDQAPRRHMLGLELMRRVVEARPPGAARAVLEKLKLNLVKYPVTDPAAQPRRQNEATKPPPTRWQSTLTQYEAIVLATEGKTDAALALISRPHTSESFGVASLLAVARQCLRRNHLAAAESLLHLALTRAPHSPAANRCLARVYLKQRRHLESCAHAKRSISSRYYNPSAHYLYGVSLLKIGQREAARSALTTCRNQAKKRGPLMQRCNSIISRLDGAAKTSRPE